MVGPEGRKSVASINSLECQTGENRPIDSKQLFADLSNQPPDTPESKSPAEPASINGADLRNLGPAQNTPEGEADQDFDWSRDTLIHKQPAIGIYWNTKGDVVIRQEVGYPDDDAWITIDPLHLPKVIAKLQRMYDGAE